MGFEETKIKESALGRFLALPSSSRAVGLAVSALGIDTLTPSWSEADQPKEKADKGQPNAKQNKSINKKNMDLILFARTSVATDARSALLSCTWRKFRQCSLAALVCNYVRTTYILEAPVSHLATRLPRPQSHGRIFQSCCAHACIFLFSNNNKNPMADSFSSC